MRCAGSITNISSQKMKRTGKFIMATVIAMAATASAHAQYYEIAGQLPSLISPALSGSLNYKGFVEASGTAGIGDSRANFIGVSTSQGFKYADWFFMGVGIGVDVAMAKNVNYDDQNQPPYDGDYYYHSSDKTKVMIPVFTDFRFNIGSQQNVSAFIDLKVGASWLIGDTYLALDNGYLSNGTQFYLKPSVGVRIPVDKTHLNRAFNISVTYQLLTSNNNYRWYNDGSVTLSNFGVTLGYEW